ncbi:MAG TPA: hypothetical protein VGG19_00305 [Tepidisphaeraceae bacterium]|jgi:hypothetical protein
MITFPCKCGQIIQVADDQAGLTVQCPHCGLLRDVPTLSDLSHLTDDGTYDLEPTKEIPEEHRIDQLRRAFSYERTDADGDEIDLRPTMTDVKSAGYIEEKQDDAAPALPKYDPVTGELVVPIQVRAEESHPNHIPLAKRFVGYATTQTQSAHFSAAKIFIELLQPVNIVVMFFILMFHTAFEFFTALPLLYSLFFSPFLFAIFTAVFAHYAIVVEEIAVEEHDELPRPLRQFEFGPDLFWPFMYMVGSIFFSFAPAFFVATELNKSKLQWPAFLAMVIIGIVFFPSVLLTSITSGSIRNLRPDRLVGVMVQSPLRYLFVVILFPAVTTVYYFGILGCRVAFLRWAGAGAAIPASWDNQPLLVIGALVIGIYMMHFTCWYLALIYRDYHADFPWVLQRHIPTRLLERTRT